MTPTKKPNETQQSYNKMMPNSTKKPPSDPQNELNSNTQKRICDFCSESVALLYCRADSAKLCLSCDREVHSTNQLFTKHTRFQLCDGCNSSPASILCFSESSVLCQNCDFEVHRGLGGCGGPHDRRPLEGFSGCPSAVELSGFVGFEGKCLGEKEGFDEGLVGRFEVENEVENENDGFSELFGWDSPSVVSIDELIGCTDKTHSFQAMVVRPLPKDRNYSCGQHKQEILHQLRRLANSETDTKKDSDPLVGLLNVTDENEKEFTLEHMLQAYQHDEEHATLRGLEARSCAWGNEAGEAGEAATDIFVSCALSGNHVEESVLNSDRPSNISGCENRALNGCNSQEPNGSEPLPFPQNQKVAAPEVVNADRDSALSRYKEKKRTRRYEKHIRYESRKVQAEHRTRIKGRFAKIERCRNQS